MEQVISPRGLKLMQESPSSGTCARNHRAGVAVWEWGKSRGHKGKYLQHIRGKFRDFERVAEIAMPLQSPCSWGKIEIIADCPSLWSASTLDNTSEKPRYAAKYALWWSLSSLRHWTKFLWQVHGTTSLLSAHSAPWQFCKVFWLCSSCALKSGFYLQKLAQ